MKKYINYFRSDLTIFLDLAAGQTRTREAVVPPTSSIFDPCQMAEIRSAYLLFKANVVHLISVFPDWLHGSIDSIEPSLSNYKWHKNMRLQSSSEYVPGQFLCKWR